MRHLLAAAALTGCTASTAPPETYDFLGRTGEDSVDYSGQVFRNLLIGELVERAEGLTDRIDGGFAPAEGDVAAELEFYLSFDSATAGTNDFAWSSDPAPLQTTFDDVSSGKNLLEKLAGNDEIGQHVDWSTGLVGWDHPDVTTPESLVRHWVDTLDALAVDRANGNVPTGPDGAPITVAHVTAEGHDLAELLDKFLRGAIAYSQGADDYLDDDVDGKGLLSDHSAVEEGEAYTALEHAWDEGFGYFGAARAYGTWSHETIASPSYADDDGDGAIDLLREVAWGHAAYAGKRDASAVVATDLSGDAFAGFVAGRHLLATTDGDLSESELAELRTYRDAALFAWESAIAASIVHYINETLVDTQALGTDAYDFEAHAKHWSELKGLALALQFSPHMKLSDMELGTLHALVGAGPALDPDDALERGNDLVQARILIGRVYGFDDANLGDSDGANGW